MSIADPSERGSEGGDPGGRDIDSPTGARHPSRRQTGIPVPASELSREALAGVIEAFVLREGTDYGAREFTLDEKVQHVRSQIERGEATIVFDPDSETVTIVVQG